MNSKRKIEKDIFNKIYKPEEGYTFDHSDKPDFWLISQPHYNFGVEITELFENESSARLDKIEGYLGELLDKRKFRHKDDKKGIVIDKIKILDKNENLVSKEEAVIKKTPSIKDFRNFLTKKIKEKSDKAQKYNPDLDYYNLIIQDNIDALFSIQQDKISEYLFTEKFKSALLNSSFEEIFLITKINKKEVSFPLKRILFLYHNYMFQEIITQLHKPNEPLQENYYYSFLIEFLEFQGFKKIKILKNKEDYGVIYANTGFTIKNNSVQLILFKKLDEFFFKETKSRGKYITPDIEKLIIKEKSKFGFSCGLETIIQEKQ